MSNNIDISQSKDRLNSKSLNHRLKCNPTNIQIRYHTVHCIYIIKQQM